MAARSFTAEEASFLTTVSNTAKKRSLDKHIGSLLEKSAKSPKKKQPCCFSPARRENYAQRVGFHVERSAAPQPRDDDTISEGTTREEDEEDHQEEENSPDEKENIRGVLFTAEEDDIPEPPTGPLDAWTQMFGLYKTFVKEFGSNNTKVFPTAVYRNAQLGKWVSEQCSAYSDGTLTRKRKQKLEAVGFEWGSSETYDANLAWMHMLGLLQAFRKEFGTWPQNDTFYRNFRLGKWMKEQRLVFEIGGMDKDRKRKLESIKFPWDQKEHEWNSMMDLLQDHKHTVGTCLIPDSTVYKGIMLGNWVSDQIEEFRNGTMTAGHERRFQEIGYAGIFQRILDQKEHKPKKPTPPKKRRKSTSSPKKPRVEVPSYPRSHDVHWNHYFNHLLAYRDEFGTCFVPSGTVYKGVKLGDWVSEQIDQVRNDTIHPTHLKLLEDVGYGGTFDRIREQVEQHGLAWSQQQAAPKPHAVRPIDPWVQMFEVLQAYKDEYGTPFAHRDTVYQGEKLGEWIEEQMEALKRGTLLETYKLKMDDIGYHDVFMKIEIAKLKEIERKEAENFKKMQEEELKDPWNQMYDLLKKFKRDYGTALVPKDVVYQGVPLGQWASEQVEKVERGELESQYREKLDRVGYALIFKKMADKKFRESLQANRNQQGIQDPMIRAQLESSHRQVQGTLEANGNQQAIQERPPPATFNQPPMPQLKTPSTKPAEKGNIYRARNCPAPVSVKKPTPPSAQRLTPPSTQKPKPLVFSFGEEEESKPPSTSPWSTENASLGRQQLHWNKMFENLKAYKRENGNCTCVVNWPEQKGQVPFSYATEDGSTLGSWVRNQRVRRTNGALRPELEEKLNTIGFLWRVQAGPRKMPNPVQIEHLDKRWNEMFDRLVEYKNRHGNCQILTAGTYRGLPLGEWVRTQRKKYKEGSLRQDRKERLEGIGFVWKVTYTPPANMPDISERGMQAKKASPSPPKRDPQSDTSSPKKSSPNNNSVVTNRENKFQSSGSPNENDQLWMQNFELLQAYKTHRGELAGLHIPESTQLGEWVQTQRSMYRSGQLDGDRIRLLESIGFPWVLDYKEDPVLAPHDDVAWKNGLQHLKDFKEEYGHTCVQTSAHYRRFKLGEWVRTQRKLYKENRLVASRVQILDEVGMQWVVSGGQPRERHWNAMFEALKKFKAQNGNCMVRAKGSPLGEWVRTQRKKHKEGSMRKDRLEKLEEIGFVWKAGSNGNPLMDDESGQRTDSYSDDEVQIISPPEHYRKPDPPTSGEVVPDKALSRQPDPPSRPSHMGSASEAQSARQMSHDANVDAQFNLMVQRLSLYREQTGNCLVPKFTNFMGSKLGEWVFDQRMKWENGMLPQHHKEQLDAVGFVWDVPNTVRNQMMLNMRLNNGGMGGMDPMANMGNPMANMGNPMANMGNPMANMGNPMANVGAVGNLGSHMGNPMGAMTGMGGMNPMAAQMSSMGMGQVATMGGILSDWLRTQFQLHMQGMLRLDHQEKLAAIGYTWGPPPNGQVRGADSSEDYSWNDMYDKLKFFIAQHGDALLPSMRQFAAMAATNFNFQFS